MSQKFNVLATVTDHLDTFHKPNDHSLHRWDVVWMYGIPLLLGGVVAVCGIHLRHTGEIIAGVSILTGLLFALVIYVFQLRLQVANDPRVKRDGFLASQLDELFANVSYAVLVGLLVTVVGVVASATEQPESATWEGGVNRWWSAVITIAGVHLVLTVLMCLKRTRSAYHELTI